MLIKTRHGAGPAKLLHPLPEVSQPMTCFWAFEQEGFEILESGGLALHLQADVKPTTFQKSSSRNCREVKAGVPSRRPPGVKALRSPGQVLLLAVMDIRVPTPIQLELHPGPRAAGLPALGGCQCYQTPASSLALAGHQPWPKRSSEPAASTPGTGAGLL